MFISCIVVIEYIKIGGFSGGMKQRVLIASALLGDPDLIILDEPTAELDPKQRVIIRNMVSNLGKEKIIIISTHIVSDIETIAKEQELENLSWSEFVSRIEYPELVQYLKERHLYVNDEIVVEEDM